MTTSEIDLRQAAQQPRFVSVDGRQVTQHGLRDQIEADRYEAAKAAARRRTLGVRLQKVVPPGAQ